MKKKVFSMLLVVSMLLAMLPMTVSADSVESVTVSNYTDLVTNLNKEDPELKKIIIAGQSRDAVSGTYKAFDWEDCTVLDLATSSSRQISISGPWVIPEGITVNVGQEVFLEFVALNGKGPSITVNGTWNIAHINGTVHGNQDYETLTISESGKLTAIKNLSYSGSFTPVSGKAKLVLNGTLDLNSHAANVNNWVVGPNATFTSTAVSGNEALLLQAGATLTGIDGATISFPVQGVYDNGSAFLSGDLTLSRLNFTQSGTLTIAENSHITTKYLYAADATNTALTVNGTLELDADLSNMPLFTHCFQNGAVMTINQGGVLKLNPGNYLDTAEVSATVNGQGTIMLYALYDETLSNYHTEAAVFGNIAATPSQVADTVTIWRNWENNTGSGDSDNTDDPSDPHTLSAPTNLTWDKYYYNTENGVGSISYPGMIGWQVADTEYDQDFELTLYKNGEELYTTGWSYYTENDPYLNDWDFSLSELEYYGSGNYTFTVKALGDGETTSDSVVATSDTWTYTKPESVLTAPAIQGWTGATAAWNQVAGDNVGGYKVDIYYSATDGKAESTENLKRVFGYVRYNCEGVPMTSFDMGSFSSPRLEPIGYYYYTATTVSGDVNQVRHSAPSALSAAYHKTEGTTPTATVTYVSNGGSAVASETIDLRETSAFTKPADPTRDGYTFAGWFWDEALEVAYDFSIGADPGEALVLYAKWIENSAAVEPDYDNDDDYYVPTTSTTTQKNDDGSVTTTTTNKVTGTVTETTKNTDGSTSTVVTEKDGTVTETNKTADGVTSTVVTDKTGEITEISASVPTSAAKNANENGAAVTLPVEVSVTRKAESAPTVEISIPSKVDSVTVEIPVDNATPGTVVILVDAKGNETVVNTTGITENGVVVALTGDATVKIVDNSKEFEDVQDGDWYSNAAAFVSSRELMNGMTEDTFGHNVTSSRAMIAQILHNMEGKADHEFTGFFGDVAEDDWYADAIHWAADNGIISGTGNGNFDPMAAVTREQLAVMLWKYSGSEDSDHYIGHFNDDHEISSWAETAMKWAVEHGLMSGKGNGQLDPKGEATRAEVASVLMNFYKNVKY